jgi:glycosyltransferase involved in cell wall biosynthesis
MRVVHVGIARPVARIAPEELLRTWVTLPDVASATARAGAEVTVIQAFHENAERVVGGVRYVFVDEPALPRRIAGLMPWRLVRAVQAAQPQAIHVNGLDFPVHTRLLCRLGVPVLVQDHCSAPEGPALRRRWGLAKAAGIAFTDARQADAFHAHNALPPRARIFEVPESSTHFSAGDQATARAASGIHGDPAVLMVARLAPRKDPLTALRAVEIAARELPGLQLWCVFHEAPMRAEVEAMLAASPDLAARVHLIGRVPHIEIETLCRAADFFLLASRREGSGYALIEALACGATPIVSDILAFRGLVGDDGTMGALSAPGDAEGFARGLVRLAAEPREALRARAIGHFRRHLSFEAVGARLCEIYAELGGAQR